MRISDWSSDVCSSDLLVATVQQDYLSRSVDMTTAQIVPLSDWQAALADVRGVIADAIETPPSQADIDREANEKLGRASCRERVCHTCRSRWVPDHSKKNKTNIQQTQQHKQSYH